MFQPPDYRNINPNGLRGTAQSLLTSPHETPSYAGTAKSDSGFTKYLGPLGGIVGTLGGMLVGAPMVGGAVGSALGNMASGAAESNAGKALGGASNFVQQKPVATWLTNALGGGGG